MIKIVDSEKHQKEDTKKEDRKIREEEIRRKREKEGDRDDERIKSKSLSRSQKKKPKESVKTPQKKLKLPLLRLESKIPNLKEVKINDEIPEIEKEKRKSKIPLLKLEKISLKEREFVLSQNVPDIKEETRELQIPIFQLLPNKRIRSILEEFKEKIPEVRRRELSQTKIRIPIYRKPFTIRLRSIFDSLNTSVDERVDKKISVLVEKRRKKEQNNELKEIFEEAYVMGEGNASIPFSGSEEDIPDPFNLIFRGVSGGLIKPRGSKIILFREQENDSYIGIFETLCIRIHREINGGEPEVQRIKKIDEMNKREIEKWMKANKKIITIDLDADRKNARDLDKNHLLERLGETITGPPGFIIFSTKDQNLFDYYSTLLKDIQKQSHHPLKTSKVTPNEGLDFSVKRELARLIWGNVEMSASTPEFKKIGWETQLGTKSFDTLCNKTAQELFNKKLEQFMNEEDTLFKRATTRNNGQIYGKERDDYRIGESHLHYSIKVFLVNYLTNKLREKGEILDERESIKNRIPTEEPFNGGTQIPDVQVDREIYEVETLFGEEENATKKIDETIDKYRDIENVEKINIVLDNLTFLRHLKELVQISKHFSYLKNTHGESIVNFYTLDLKNKELLPLKLVIKKLKNIQNNIDQFSSNKSDYL